MDVLLGNQVTSHSSNEYATEVAGRLEEAHKLAREQLGAADVYSKGWYDRNDCSRREWPCACSTNEATLNERQHGSCRIVKAGDSYVDLTT